MVRRPYANGNRDTRSRSAWCVSPALPLAVSVCVTDTDVVDATLVLSGLFVVWSLVFAA
jgi:hypothetical protein